MRRARKKSVLMAAGGEEREGAVAIAGSPLATHLRRPLESAAFFNAYDLYARSVFMSTHSRHSALPYYTERSLYYITGKLTRGFPAPYVAAHSRRGTV